MNSPMLVFYFSYFPYSFTYITPKAKTATPGVYKILLNRKSEDYAAVTS